MPALIMRPEMVYEYPIWAIGLGFLALTTLGALLLELAARRLMPGDLRRRHNDVTAAIFGVVGVTYAVLAAFVAMLAWEGFNRAKAASYQEAAAIGAVHTATIGLPGPAASAIEQGVRAYLAQVIGTEWPAQAAGRPVDGSAAPLAAMVRIAAAIRPADAAGSNLQAQLLQAVGRLQEARQTRLLATETTVPPAIWVVLLTGGALTVGFASFLGAPSLRMHLAMIAVLALSGALVVLLIFALSNPFRGDFRVSTEPFDRLLATVRDAGN